MNIWHQIIINHMWFPQDDTATTIFNFENDSVVKWLEQQARGKEEK